MQALDQWSHRSASRSRARGARGDGSRQQLGWHAEHRTGLGEALVERVHRGAMLRRSGEMQRIYWTGTIS